MFIKFQVLENFEKNQIELKYKVGRLMIMLAEN